MNARTIRLLISIPIAAVVCAGVSYLVARILLASRNGFGSSDLPAFMYWTVMFAVLLSVLALAFAYLMRNFRTINRVWIAVLIGGVAGFGWTLLNLVMLGPWFGAWSFNVLYCWIAGGAFGFLAVAIFGASRRAPA
jgi:hypothetical protein